MVLFEKGNWAAVYQAEREQARGGRTATEPTRTMENRRVVAKGEGDGVGWAGSLG